jgi:hypothetical protein
MEETIYFFAGNLDIGKNSVKFINGIYVKQVNTKESVMELLKEIEAFVINHIGKDYPLQKISFQINNISILGKGKFENE